MYSGSNSYLGGQIGRPGQQQQQYGSYQQPQQQQFGAQPTGFGMQQQMQPQMTGFQPQQTGFQGGMQQQQAGFPGQMQPQPTGFQPQIGGQQSFGPSQSQLQPPAPVQKPAATGYSQMAASFQTAPAPASKPDGRRKATSRIPSIRLSFITAKDQAQFETLFRSAVGDGQSMSGDKARDILLRSDLEGNVLSQIWYGSLHSLAFYIFC